MSKRPNEPVMPTEPDAEADTDAGEDEDGFAHYEKFDKKRRAMLSFGQNLTNPTKHRVRIFI